MSAPTSETLTAQPIDPDTRRLFLAQMEAEANGTPHWARALRDLLWLQLAEQGRAVPIRWTGGKP